MQSTKLVGTWGFNHGYRVGGDEARLVFNADGSGIVNPHGDSFAFHWKLKNSSELYLSLKGDHWIGPHNIQVGPKSLPLGTFISLVSDVALLPFGLKQFQLIEAAGA